MNRNYLIYWLTVLLLFKTVTSYSQVIDPNYYYRLTTSWQGDGKSLDVVNDGKNNRVTLATTGSYSGQYWRFISVGNGYYRISNGWEKTKSLDIINDGKNNTPWLDKTANLTGQYWKITPLGGGFYRFTCQWQGDGKSLDIINDGKNNTPSLAGTANVSGQYWKLTKLNLIPEDNGFSMIFASDSQWPWTSRTDAGDTKETESEKETNATTLNENHVKSINNLVNTLGNVKGLIINGDLTAFGHSNELEKFKSIYKSVKVPMYLGLGNHDYANNVDDTYENNCANRMVEYMISHIKSNGSSSSDYNVSDSYVFPEYVTTTTGSLSYSWDIGNVHFVQLQNYPIYQRQWSNYVSVGAAKRKTVKITSALNWLATDLAKARNAGKIIILNYHDSDEHWPDKLSATEYSKLSAQFTNLLSTYKVAAVFVGHYHSLIGKENLSTKLYGSTPIFFCGSASQSKFLLVNFKDNKMTVEHVSSLNTATTRSDKTEYTLFDKAESVPLPKQDGWVTFFNEGAFEARYTLTYTLNGETKKIESGTLILGNKVRYDIPGDATNIVVKGEGTTGLIWDPWWVTFNLSFTGAPNKCFRSYNTTLHQKWDNDCK